MLLPVLLIVVAIIQFGILFAGYVATSNAAREGGRAGSIYIFNRSLTPLATVQANNDLKRCESVLTAVQSSIGSGVLGSFSGSCATVNGGGDLAISYPDAGTCTASSRKGCQIRVQVSYRQPMIVPLIGQLLPLDNGLFVQTAAVTMVVN